MSPRLGFQVTVFAQLSRSNSISRLANSRGLEFSRGVRHVLSIEFRHAPSCLADGANLELQILARHSVGRGLKLDGGCASGSLASAKGGI